MQRWLLLGFLVVGLVALGMLYLNSQRVRIPEDCQKAVAALEAQDHDLAIDHYLLCLDDEDLPEAAVAQVFAGLGLAYAAKGNHFQAIEDYSEAIRRNPNLAWTYNNRCWSYGLLRRAEEALADCNQALRLLPDQAAILDSRALAYWLLDDKDKARADLERARKINPEVPAWDDRFRQFEEMF